MERHLIDANATARRTSSLAPRASGPSGAAVVAPGGFDDRRGKAGGEARRALLTCMLAMYPLVGSATIILAALMLAGGTHA